MGCPIVRPDTVRLSLSGGEWLDVRRELNAGEYFDLILATSERKAFSKPLAYLIGWSFTDLDGGPLPYDPRASDDERRALLRTFRTDTIREIIATVNRHEEAQDLARAAKKNDPTTSLASSPTFASVGP